MKPSKLVPAFRRWIGRALGRAQGVPRGTPPIDSTHIGLTFKVPIEHAAWYRRAIDAIVIPPGIDPEIGTIAFVYAAGRSDMAMICGQLVINISSPEAPKISKPEHILAVVQSLGAIAGNARVRAEQVCQSQGEAGIGLAAAYINAERCGYMEPAMLSKTSAEAAAKIPPAIYGAMARRDHRDHNPPGSGDPA